MKIAIITPLHKKEHKNLVKNDRPISLLPTFDTIDERVIYNDLLNYFKSNKFFTPSQSDFLPGDLYMVQLLSIMLEI